MTAIRTTLIKIICDTRVGYTPRQQDEVLPGVQRRSGSARPAGECREGSDSHLSSAVALPTESDILVRRSERLIGPCGDLSSLKA
jgi:hypothetical protein